MIQGERILVTGAAGFIGFHLSRRLLADGAQVLGIDNMTPYYDVALKEARVALLQSQSAFHLEQIDVANKQKLADAWSSFQPSVVIHLAAQAGVRHSLEAPEIYVSSNLIGTFNVLEIARRQPVRHLLAASTSSVYGGSLELPFKENSQCASPLSFYAATKCAAELMGHSYAHLFGTPMTFFRFFTVYGPWGRPDMAYFSFAEAICEGRAIDVYNNGDMYRDFTYIDDLIEAIVRLIPVIPGAHPPVAGDSLSAVAPHRVVNIGQTQPTGLMDMIGVLERTIGASVEKRFLPMQSGDVHATHASSDLLRNLTGYVPSTDVEEGMRRFVDWYKDVYKSGNWANA